VLSGYARLVRRIRNKPAPRAHLEGIAKAKAAGVYKGRPASIDAARVRATKTQIAKALEIGRASVYRALEAG
jgi:DNA invertase Pin-like site-specific DNA recombinase